MYVLGEGGVIERMCFLNVEYLAPKALNSSGVAKYALILTPNLKFAIKY